ncbi:MAG: flagellar hook-basal body complex protein [Fretibacterium sp.]|nr:flagellar hook-basal body complex protein [Fretibacterium sp.]
MLRSLMTAVTGVKAHQTMLDVTGNNIANVNTTGYKRDFTVFQDLLYQTTQGATGPGDNRGGINPAQVGLGVSVAAIETIHAQGGAQYTGNKTDMMIEGDGYFVVRDGGTRMYTRAGNFVRDAQSNLVHSGTGYHVQGYKLERDPLDPRNFIRAGGDVEDINIPIGRKMPARATTLVDYQCNLDSRSRPYLPIGYADLPFNAPPCGKDAVVKIDDIEYDMSFQTADLEPLVDGTGYFTVTLKSGADEAELVFNMTGVKDGKPMLEYQHAAVNWPGTNPPVPINADDVRYNNDTGWFELVKNGATVFKTNLHEDMHYNYFEVKDGTNPPITYKVLAEFDEKQPPKPSGMAGSPMNLTLWFMAPGATPADPLTITKATAVIPISPDGRFEFARAEFLPGQLPPAGFDVAGDPPNFRIVPAGGNGETVTASSALTIQVAKNMATPSTFDTVSQINQGGFHQTKQDVFDCQGNRHTLEVNFKKLTENRWRWEAFLLADKKKLEVGEEGCEPQTTGTGSESGGLTLTPSSGEIAFCPCGPICSPESVELDVPFSLDGKSNSKITLNFGGHGDKMAGITQFASPTTTKAIYQDGYEMGVMNDFNTGQDGRIVGVYTNGQSEPIYQIALATFANPAGLDKLGNSMFAETVNSGQANIDPAMLNGKGVIKSGNLEMSNVDLTEEFTRLIIAQRGFQANTRVVTTSDQILEEVVNIKR